MNLYKFINLKIKTIKFISIQLILIVIFSLIYYNLNPDNFIFNNVKNNTNNKINKNINYIDYLYFSTITSSSTGYGDILPSTDICRIIVMVQVLLTYTNIISTLIII